MSFFDNSKHVGLAIIIVGLISLISAVIKVYEAWSDDSDLVVAALRAVAAIIFGLLMFLFGMKVAGGPNDKVAFLSGLIKVFGIAIILGALFSAVAQWIETSSLGAGLLLLVATIIVGLILLWVAAKISGKSKNIISKFLWLIVLVVFAILAILSILNLITSLTNSAWGDALSYLCWIIICIFAVVACLSPEVKKSMGI